MSKNITKILDLFITVLISFSLFVNTAIACSDVMISGNGYTAVARNQQHEENSSYVPVSSS